MIYNKRKGPSAPRSAMNIRKLGVLASSALFVLLIIAAPVSNITYAAKLDVTQFQLEVTPIAPKLPADEGTYYAMIELETAKDRKPIAAPSDLDITLTSSDPSVVAIGQDKFTLQKGESILKAELKTTKKPGEASLSGQAEGIKSASVTITTLLLDSLEPTKLAISAAISSGKGTGVAVPDPKAPETMYIELLNSRDLPAISDKSVLVSLSSSKPQVGTIPSFATIPAGQSGVTITFSPKTELGTTTISASSPGLTPTKIDMKTDGPVATKLAVDFGPSVIATGSGYGSSTMSVQLRDDDDNPVKATSKVLVTLKSSDESVAQVPLSVEIQPGQSYAIAPVRAQGGLGCVDPDILNDGYGCALITASATGFTSGIGTLKVIQAAEENLQYSIYLYSLPEKLPPDNSEHASIVMQFVYDNFGQDTDHPIPYLPVSNTLFNGIVLSTSDSKLGTINSDYVAMNGYAIAKFTTTYFTGTTTITGSRTGYAPALDGRSPDSSKPGMTLDVEGSAPAALKLTQIPTIVEANNIESDFLAVSLADSKGKPVIAPEDTMVSLASSDPTIASIDASVIIPAGQAYVIEKVSVTDKAGQSTISASSATLASSNLAFETQGSKGTISQYALGLYAIPKISADDREYEAVFVQLQDLAGNPLPAKEDIKVTLSSSSNVAGKIEPEVTIPSGSSYVAAKFDTSTTPDTAIKVTASSPGFKSVETNMQTTVQPLALKITNSVPKQGSFGDNDIFVQVSVTSYSLPVEGASIEIGGPQSDPTNVMTDENGLAEGRYVSVRPGTNNIEVTASKPGYQQITAKTSTTLAQTVTVTVRAMSEGGAEVPAEFKIAAAAPTAKSFTSDIGKPVVFKNAKWGSYRITAPESYTNSAGKFEFVSWSDGKTDNPRAFDVVDNTEIRAIYHAQFSLQASSPYGVVSGNGFYNEGAMATLSIDKTSVSEGLLDKTFVGWKGDIDSQSPTTQVKMNAPKVITADWQTGYLKIAILGGGVAGAGLIAYFKVLRPRKLNAEKSKAPDLDWYKS